jgi:uncharacterized protein
MSMIHKFSLFDKYMVLDVNSGAVHVLDEVAWKVIDYLPSCNKDRIIDLLKEKYDTRDIIEAYSELKALQDKELLFSPDYYGDIRLHNNGIIKALCLHIAHDCNIRCKYCFASTGSFHGQRLLMDYETGKSAIDFLIEHSGNRHQLEIDFFGGEPLLNKRVIKELVDYGNKQSALNNKDIRFTITTNALLLDDEVLSFINDKMYNLVLSIDGTRETNDRMRYFAEGRGTYDLILPKIRKAVETRGDKSFYVRGTFTRYNLDFSKDVLHLADLGLKSISIEPVVADENEDYAIREEDLPVVFKEYETLAFEYVKRYKTGKPFDFFHFNIDLSQGPCVIKRVTGCGAGSEYVAITPEGDIYPCHQFVGNEDFCMGNVRDGIINKKIGDEFRACNVLQKEECKKCWAKFYCSGGCHASAYYASHDIHSTYPIGCEMERKRLECAMWIKAALSD